MGGHDLKPPEVPDWRIYRVEDVPELTNLRKNLAARGRCYPWLRNEVWKYPNHPIEKSFIQAFKFMFCGGFKYGLAAAIVTIIVDKAYLAYVDKTYGGEHAHHH